MINNRKTALTEIVILTIGLTVQLSFLILNNANYMKNDQKLTMKR